MIKLTILISTMNEQIEQLISKVIKIPSDIDIIICHQITNLSINAVSLKNSIEDIRSNTKVIQMYDNGLSKSRNCLLNHVYEGICLIADDDVDFTDNFYEQIMESYRLYPDADIITFQIKTPEGEPFKQYSTKNYIHTKKTLMRVASIEITFRANVIHENKLFFDEDFGLGSIYPTGEETIFLCDAIDKQLKLLYSPMPIVIHPKEHSNASYSIDLFKAKGAAFIRIFGLTLGTLIILLFTLKKYNDFKKEFSFLKSFITMFKSGFIYYKEQKNEAKNGKI